MDLASNMHGSCMECGESTAVVQMLIKRQHKNSSISICWGLVYGTQ